MKSKKKNNNRYKNNQDKVLKINYPRTFFRSIGIKPYVKANEKRQFEHLQKAISSKFGHDIWKRFIDNSNEYDDGYVFNQCHTTLDFVKIWNGVDFNRICLIANIIQKIDIPNNKNVLDLGGGAGQIAFFMAHLWPDSTLTVIDKYSHIGKEWAGEINEGRVHFKNGTLSNLKTIEGCKYDLIIMPRVIGNLEDLALPSDTNTFDTSSYLQSQEGKNILRGLKEIGTIVKKHLTDGGHLVLIDSWSSIRALLIANAFEKVGLYIDIDHFHPESISMKYSSIVFSKAKPENLSQDLPIGFAMIADRNEDGAHCCFSGQYAEVFRSLFAGSKVLFEDTFSIKALDTSFKQEVLEKNGIAIKYISTTDGIRRATIGPSLYLPILIESCKKDKKVLESDDAALEISKI